MEETKQYALYVQKLPSLKNCIPYFKYHFSVVDIEKAPYPKNFCCVLPKDVNENACHNNTSYERSFKSIFPDVDRTKFAIALLKQAQIDYAADPDVVEQIKIRINDLKVRYRLKHGRLAISD